MTQVVAPSASARPVLLGAVGGALGALVALAVGAFFVALAGRSPLAMANGVGAWLVRWLQTAAVQALDNFYLDATLGGLVVALVAGALGGALVGGWLARRPASGPVLVGLLAGAFLWAWLGWGILPALDPVLASLLGAGALGAVCLSWGAVVGLWQRAASPAGASP